MGFFVVHGVRVYFQIRVFFILSILRIKNVDDILKEIIVNLEIYSYPMNHKEQSQEKEWRHSNGATWLLPYAFHITQVNEGPITKTNEVRIEEPSEVLHR